MSAAPLPALVLLTLSAATARAAVLTYDLAYRFLEVGSEGRGPAGEFLDWDETLTGLYEDPGQGLRQGGWGSQRSTLRPEGIAVLSTFSGGALRVSSFCKIDFTLDAPAAWSLTGRLSLIGSNGFVCVGLVDFANRDAPPVTQIISAPPAVAESRTLNFSGVLPPGRYSLEAMIYGGGDNLPTTGTLAVVFTIPEPRALWIVAAALSFMGRRRAMLIARP